MEAVGFFVVCFRFLVFFFFLLFRASLAVYGTFQARDPVRAAAAGLQHSHSNARSLPYIPQLMVMLDLELTEWGQGSNPSSNEC